MGRGRIVVSVFAAAGLTLLSAGMAYAGGAGVPVPLPSSLVLLAVGAGGLAWWLHKRG